jgi:hypothetical protein
MQMLLLMMMIVMLLMMMLGEERPIRRETVIALAVWQDPICERLPSKATLLHKLFEGSFILLPFQPLPRIFSPAGYK